jgi:hypothetical protein
LSIAALSVTVMIMPARYPRTGAPERPTMPWRPRHTG